MEDNRLDKWENSILPPTPRTVDAMMCALAERVPDWTAARDGSCTRTFAELNRTSGLMAAALQERGVKSGDVIFLDLEVGVALLETFLAVTRMGAIALYLHGLFKAEDVDGLIGATHPVLCIGSKAHSINHPIVEPLELMNDSTVGIFPKPTEEQVAWYRTTSGTTGRPKVIAVEHRQLCRRLPFPGLHYRSRYVYGAPLPNAFIGYQIMTALGTGGTIAFRPSSTAAQVQRFIEEENIDYLWGVPALLQQMTRTCRGETRRTSPSLRAITSSGAYLPLETQRIIESTWGVPVVQFYGQSELGFLTECYSDSPKNSVGKSVPGVRLRIVDEQGRSLPAEKEGRIQTMMDVPFGGYITGETSPVNTEGWFSTGDLGYLDQEGNLFLSGRETDQIQVSGYKVNATEVAEYIKKMKGIKNICVFPASHPLRGEVVAVAVCVETQVKAEDIRKFCKKMPRHKQPGPIYLLPYLPQTPLGKIDKRALMVMLEDKDSTNKKVKKS